MKNLWEFLDGKKTAIAGVYYLICTQLIPIWFTNGVPENVEKLIISIHIILLYLGIGHKAVKVGLKK